jgi:acetyl-CoA synthetase
VSDSAGAFLKARDLLLQHRTDLASARAAFRWPALDQFNWALDVFDPMADGNEQAALRIVGLGTDTSISFAALSARSNQVANFLCRVGVQRGERILMLLGNVQPLWEVMLAAMKLGAVLIPATTMLTEDDLRDRLARGRVRHVIASADIAPRFASLCGGYTRIAVGGAPGWRDFAESDAESTAYAPGGQTRATDPLLLYFTSGTTSKPKLVLHSHESYPVGHLSTMYWIGAQPGDVHLNISSPGWAKHAYSSFFAPWNAGATILILNQARFDAAHMLRVLDQCSVTTFCAPPTVWRMLVQEDLKAKPVHLREAVSAGEPLNPEVIEQVQRAWNLTIRDGYGQTETTLQVGNMPGQAVTPGSMGLPAPGYSIRLIDPDGQDVEEGEIAIALDPAPAGLMQGYLGEDGTVRAPSGVAYRTGDIGMRNADGSLTYVGRADDVFKSSDYRISPFELESVLVEHAAVAEAAVVPSPDPVRTSLPKAFIAVAEGHAASAETASSIFAHARARLAPYKRIRRIEFCELPKTISGKIRRVDLRRMEAARRQAGETGPLEFVEEVAKV